MAQVSFPLENTWYTAGDAQLWQVTRSNGVFSSDVDLVTQAVTGMRISVSEGIAWLHPERFKGFVFGNTAAINFDLAQADGTLKRIDRVVVHYDYITNKTDIRIKKGAFGSTPVAPALIREAGVAYELALADILVDRGVLTITQSNITDKRMDETVCGIMSDGVRAIPSAMLVAQWESWFTEFKNNVNGDTTELTEWIYLFKQQSQEDFDAWMATKEVEFTEWFDTIKGMLSGDLAGSLALAIDEVDRRVDVLDIKVNTVEKKVDENALVASFFDNAVAFPGTYFEPMVTSKNGTITTYTENMKITATNKMYAQQITVVTPAVKIETTQTIYEPDGITPKIKTKETYDMVTKRTDVMKL